VGRRTGKNLAAAAALLIAGCAAQGTAHTVRATASPRDCDHPATLVSQGPLVLPRVPTDEVQVRVLVTVSAAGRVTQASISKSSKFPELDAADLVIAEKSTYAPAFRHCKPVASTLTYAMTYTSNWSTRNTTPLPFASP
jgi:TonB family protein